MASAGVNVLRYSALGAGVLYGAYHQRSITATQKAASEKREWDHKKTLIEQARAEYIKTRQPAAPASLGGGLNQDPMDPKFDLEAYLTGLMK